MAVKAGEKEGSVLQTCWKLGYPRLATRLQRMLGYEHEDFEKYDFVK